MSTNQTIPALRHGACRSVSMACNEAQTQPMLNAMRLLLLSAAWLLGAIAHAQSYYNVDCTGANPAYYPTIASALAVAGPNSYVLINGPCNENVSIANAWNLNVGAYYGSTATINGIVTVTSSNSVFLYGLNVTNPSGDGFDVNSSHNVTLWTCTSNGNSGVGLSVQNLSDVAVDGPGSFDSNGNGGMTAGGNSILNLNGWGGSVDISNNHSAGVGVGDGAMFQTLGNNTITNNINTTVPGGARPDGFGIQAVSASKVQVGNCFGTTQISGNQSGGIDAREDAQVSLWNCGTLGENLVSGNGPVGISVGIGSELALYSNVVISGQTGPGVELYARAQLYMYGPNVISQNGNAADPRSAGIVVDGNSEAYLRGGTISSNSDPGILALVNSSVDSVGASFTGNSGGLVTCDSSAYLVSDLLPPGSNPPAGVLCRTPNHLGNRRGSSSPPVPPDLTAEKARAALYQKLAHR